MSEDKKDRLAKARAAAAALRAALPAPEPTRTERLIVSFTPSEKARLVEYASETGEPLATAARGLLLAALTTLGK
ncbi:MAG: hypothetical protein ACOYXN_03280 [Acidobacteriota bacterium]